MALETQAIYVRSGDVFVFVVLLEDEANRVYRMTKGKVG